MIPEEKPDSTSVMDVDEGETMSDERPASTSNSHSATPNLFEDESTPPSTRAHSETPPVATPAKNGRGKKKTIDVQLIGDLPRAEEDAHKTFQELPGNHYQYGTLGRSREALESMTCDCQYAHGQSMLPPIALRPLFIASPRFVRIFYPLSVFPSSEAPGKSGRLGYRAAIIL